MLQRADDKTVQVHLIVDWNRHCKWRTKRMSPGRCPSLWRDNRPDVSITFALENLQLSWVRWHIEDPWNGTD